ncbi:MAG TPA: dephospho-CoA kinase [Gemmatimonadales bacterium]
MTLSVGLTGNIASGKSTVAELFRRWGATVIVADELVREAQAPGSPLLRDIAARFGSEMILPDGALDRPRLRRRVMGHRAALDQLNHIVHPVVQRRREELLQAARARGDRIVISDIPLLFETADPAEFDAVVLVDAPEPVRRARLLADRGLSAEEADRMLASQNPSGPKRARSDYVIDNDGDHAALERATAEVWRALLARA